MLAGRKPSGSIAVAIRLGDAALRRQLELAIAGEPDLLAAEGLADILIADDVHAIAGEASSVVLIAEAGPADLPPAVRALLPPDAGPSSIIAAVRLVAEGLLVLPDGAIQRPGTANGREEAESDGLDPSAVVLTPREREVLELLAAGASNKAIARELDVSVHTVKFHVASLLRKLGASGRLEAIGIGLRTGLLMV